MTYSCAIFEDLDGDLKRGVRDATGSEALSRFGDSNQRNTEPRERGADRDELHEAQIRKLRHIINKADIHAGHRVLEIGSGWGSFAILAVQMTQCEVDTITLSVHQQTLARKRIAACGLEDKIRVHLVDYRALPEEWKGQFDRIVSIEMIEAVGRQFLDEYFRVIDWALRPKGGIGVIQSITIPEASW
jgi:cyclopropane-fatty-acyl-phospholipid synthase